MVTGGAGRRDEETAERATQHAGLMRASAASSMAGSVAPLLPLPVGSWQAAAGLVQRVAPTSSSSCLMHVCITPSVSTPFLQQPGKDRPPAQH